MVDFGPLTTASRAPLPSPTVKTPFRLSDASCPRRCAGGRPRVVIYIFSTYSKVWSVRNRAPGIARLDFLFGLRNQAVARLDF